MVQYTKFSMVKMISKGGDFNLPTFPVGLSKPCFVKKIFYYNISLFSKQTTF